jgi:hypothetical protein
MMMNEITKEYLVQLTSMFADHYFEKKEIEAEKRWKEDLEILQNSMHLKPCLPGIEPMEPKVEGSVNILEVTDISEYQKFLNFYATGIELHDDGNVLDFNTVEVGDGLDAAFDFTPLSIAETFYETWKEAYVKRRNLTGGFDFVKNGDHDRVTDGAFQFVTLEAEDAYQGRLDYAYRIFYGHEDKDDITGGWSADQCGVAEVDKNFPTFIETCFEGLLGSSSYIYADIVETINDYEGN